MVIHGTVVNVSSTAIYKILPSLNEGSTAISAASHYIVETHSGRSKGINLNQIGRQMSLQSLTVRYR